MSTRGAPTLLIAALFGFACSEGSSDEPDLLGSGGVAGATPSSPDPSTHAGASGGGSSGAAGAAVVIPVGGRDPGGSGGSGASCTADFATTELAPVYLAFAFDVSGSMGKLDKPHHDPELKWKPVVQATKAFFADTSSSGIRASLTFFPDEDDRCDAERYLEPDVPMTLLPSTAFADAIDAITPRSADDWRGGTPTMAVLRGTYDFLDAASLLDPSAKHAVVLVTDGYPQGCDDGDDEIEAVASAIADAAARFPTYVIGVSNPAGGPDTVSNLNELAQAGTTTSAFLIATGDAEATARDFKTAIDAIRGRARSCEAAIPPNPGGQAPDPERVNVTLSQAGTNTRLGYDASCADERAWRFDDATNPKTILLCSATCEDVQRDPALSINVEFGCERVPAVPR